MMLSRLFGSEDDDAEPAVHTPGSAPSAGRIYSFLTPSDRVLVGRLYEFAQANSDDPRDVDGFAFDLACFRSSVGLTDNVGQFFDPVTGQPNGFEFERPEDEAVAQRVLTSKAMSDTEVPHDFLKAVLDPGIRSVHATDFAFLEKVVYAFSAAGADGAHDPTAVLAPRPKERLAMMKAAGMISPPEQMRMSVGSGDADAPLGNYADRIANLTPFLTDETKAMLGGLYAAAEYEGSGPTSLEMKRIDALARELALLAMRDAFWRSVDESRRDETRSSGPIAEAASRTRRLDTRA